MNEKEKRHLIELSELLMTKIRNKEITICETCDTFFEYVPLRKYCDDCRKYKRKRYEVTDGLIKNRKKIKEKQHKYYKKNSEMIKAKQRAKYLANPEKIQASCRKYYEKNREKRLAYQRKYHEENREKILAYQRKYREENRDEINARKRKNYAIKKKRNVK